MEVIERLGHPSRQFIILTLITHSSTLLCLSVVHSEDLPHFLISITQDHHLRMLHLRIYGPQFWTQYLARGPYRQSK